MTYKEELIAKIIAINPSETEKRLKRLPIENLEYQLMMYRRYNPQPSD
jgi:hypothetical protein